MKWDSIVWRKIEEQRNLESKNLIEGKSTLKLSGLKEHLLGFKKGETKVDRNGMDV